MITVGLPNFCSPIAWLAMESLCRQQTTAEWELIIYEDHCQTDFTKYYDRLKAAGCVRIIHEFSNERIPLTKKWTWMGDNSHRDSIGLILQASDCYSEPHRIETAHEAFTNGYDWVQTNTGYFYNILTGQVMLFDGGKPTGLNMAISMEQLRSFSKDVEKWSGVDYWLFTSMKDPKVYIDTSLNWTSGVDTDGYNRISLARRENYDSPKPPFYPASIDIKTILPADVIESLSAF